MQIADVPLAADHFRCAAPALGSACRACTLCWVSCWAGGWGGALCRLDLQLACAWPRAVGAPCSTSRRRYARPFAYRWMPSLPQLQLLCGLGRQADGQDHPLRQHVWQGGLRKEGHSVLGLATWRGWGQPAGTLGVQCGAAGSDRLHSLPACTRCPPGARPSLQRTLRVRQADC